MMLIKPHEFSPTEEAFPFGNKEQSPMFWEALGRAVGAFSSLEHILKQAIYKLMVSQPISEESIEKEIESFEREMKRALTIPLGRLIKMYRKKYDQHPKGNKEGFDKLISDLENMKDYRNILCHGSWGKANENGYSTPFFFKMKKKEEIFSIDDSFDVKKLNEIQKETVAISIDVVNSITRMGLEFPGTSVPELR